MNNVSSELDSFTVDGDVFKVLINSEAQYSLWPDQKDNPGGWIEAGFKGTKAECSDYVDKHWIDMRPLSLQKIMNK